MEEIVSNCKPSTRIVGGLLGLLLVAVNPAVRAETMKVCYDQWPPMTIFTTAHDSRRGVVIDMLTNIYESAGISLEFFEVPYARGMQMVREGLCDMLPEKVFSPIDDEGYVYATHETFSYPTAFVIRQDDPWRYQGIQSVRGKRVATGPGWDYSSMSEVYQAYLDDPRHRDLVEVVSGESDVVDRIMYMIIEGRVDLYADNLFVLQYIVNSNGLSDKLRIVTPGLENRLVEKPIFSSKMDPARRAHLISVWDDGRTHMTREKTTALLSRYGVEVPEL